MRVLLASVDEAHAQILVDYVGMVARTTVLEVEVVHVALAGDPVGQASGASTVAFCVEKLRGRGITTHGSLLVCAPGEVAAEITHAARLRNVDLIVVNGRRSRSIRHRSGVRRKLISTTPVPLAIVGAIGQVQRNRPSHTSSRGGDAIISRVNHR